MVMAMLEGMLVPFFGDFADMDGFRTGISNGLLATAMANAQQVFDG